jgi:hypothetical protein
MVMNMKMTVFWDVEMYCPDDGGWKHLRNVGQFLSDYMAKHSRWHV